MVNRLKDLNCHSRFQSSVRYVYVISEMSNALERTR